VGSRQTRSNSTTSKGVVVSSRDVVPEDQLETEGNSETWVGCDKCDEWCTTKEAPAFWEERQFLCPNCVDSEDNEDDNDDEEDSTIDKLNDSDKVAPQEYSNTNDDNDNEDNEEDD
jgi:hypothetical protein